MSRQSDPFGRRKSFHAAPPSAHSTQALRRRQALDAQRQRRTSAIEAARTAFRDLDDLEDLSLAGSSADEADSPPPTSPPLSDARSNSDRAPFSPALSDSSTQPPAPVISKTKRKAFKPKYKAWAKNLLSYAETLDLRYGLPEGIESDWRAVVVPKGKRCLCATANEQGGNNTILYSRVAGRARGRFYTSLPPDCLLDTVWDSHLGVLWVLDVCKWRSQYLVQCEAEMRAFFVASKLSELPTQMYSPPSLSESSATDRSGTARTLLVLPIPNLPPPLSPASLLPLLSTLSSNPAQALDISALVFPPTPSSPSGDPTAFLPPPAPIPITLPLQPTGLLLYLSQAHYESGSTPLVSWVPCPDQIAEGMEAAEGVGRMGELVSEWERVGSPRVAVAAAGGNHLGEAVEGEPSAEVVMDG
ncbi:hypothetical protein JCM10908_003437 [Rhodotorula pacifica]|uniref:uncharacterized protein n=1 Tax=Rhodotorula pacifica TaxID=1495444 RepID=UPI00316CDEBE